MYTGKGPSIWDTYTSQPGIVAEGATGQTACNSYYFYQKDVDALKSLNVNILQPGSIPSGCILNNLRPSLSLCICCANLRWRLPRYCVHLIRQVSHYRFSISWPRVLPNGIGQVNQPGVDYYKNLIAALKVANIQPMVLLFRIYLFIYHNFRRRGWGKCVPFHAPGNLVPLGFTASPRGHGRLVERFRGRLVRRIRPSLFYSIRRWRTYCLHPSSFLKKNKTKLYISPIFFFHKIWMSDKGAWMFKSDSVKFNFQMFFCNLDIQVKIWVTLNEPWITAWQGRIFILEISSNIISSKKKRKKSP